MNPKREVLDAFDDPENEAWLASWLDVYAHKLAEQQRAWLRFQGYDTSCVCGGCPCCLATEYIDLIDPKVQT